MRGTDDRTEGLFSYLSCEGRVPSGHPLRAIRPLVEAALVSLSGDFTAMYSLTGRPSIPPEKLLRALLLQAFYSVRSERQLMEQLDYNLLFRWFVGLSMDAPIWDVTVFTKNRDRLLAADVAAKFMDAVLNQPKVRALLSDEHFSVDGTLIEAWASIKSFRPKDGSGQPPTCGRNGTRDFRGEKLSNETHASTSEPDARLYKKAVNQSAKLCHMGHLLMENRHGLIVETTMTLATGSAEREAAASLVEALGKQDGITLGADKGYDDSGFIAEMARLGVVPHARGAAPRSTTRPPRSRAIRRASSAANGLRRHSAGSRRLACCARPGIGERSGWAGCLPSSRPPMTWSGCRNCWRPPHEETPGGCLERRGCDRTSLERRGLVRR
jgi:transposase